MDWRAFGKGLLKITLLGAVWGAIVGFFGLKETFGPTVFNTVNGFVIVGLVFWFASQNMGNMGSPKKDAETEPDDEDGAES